MNNDIKIMRLISIITRKHKMNLAKSLEQFDLTAGEYPLFMAICFNPGLTQDSISKTAVVDKAMTTRVLKSFYQKGLIYKEQDAKDKRINHIYPSQKALDMFPAVREHLKKENDYDTNCFTEDEINTLRSLLLRLDENINTSL